MLLPIDQFITELTNLYRATAKSGSVWVTFKQHTLKDGKRVVLVRATDGERKISLHLQQNEIKYFQDRYTSVLKHNVHKLKKRPAGDDVAAAAAASSTPAKPKRGSAKKSTATAAAAAATTTSTTTTSAPAASTSAVAASTKSNKK